MVLGVKGFFGLGLHIATIASSIVREASADLKKDVPCERYNKWVLYIPLIILLMFSKSTYIFDATWITVSYV